VLLGVGPRRRETVVFQHGVDKASSISKSVDSGAYEVRVACSASAVSSDSHESELVHIQVILVVELATHEALWV
jgi:hypothetical protein